MNVFTLNLFKATHEQKFVDIVSFVGEDASGGFGIQANHARHPLSIPVGDDFMARIVNPLGT